MPSFSVKVAGVVEATGSYRAADSHFGFLDRPFLPATSLLYGFIKIAARNALLVDCRSSLVIAESLRIGALAVVAMGSRDERSYRD